MESIDEQIFQNLKEIAGRYIALKKKVAHKNGLSLSECNMLCIVLASGPIIQSRLGECCGIDKPATSRLVNKLISENLILKFHNADNKKNSFIKISHKGKILIEKIQQEVNKEKDTFFKTLSLKDKEVALLLMEKVLAKNCE